jgi:hypothetical protein
MKMNDVTITIPEGVRDGYLGHVPPIECNDGFEMSIQAASHNYCTPRDCNGTYSHLEVGFPNRVEDDLMPYAEDSEAPTETVYCYVPVEIILKVIAKHGGVKNNLLQLEG